MISARSVNDSDPHRQRITMALLPLPTALAITAAPALLSPHPLIADVGFVLVVFTAVYVRRFGPRGTALGLVTFLSYFFSLYLRAKFSELPWLIGATLLGSLCSFVWSTFLMPDRPESVSAGEHSVAAGEDGDRRRHPPPTWCGAVSSTSAAGAGCGSGPAGSTRRR